MKVKSEIRANIDCVKKSLTEEKRESNNRNIFEYVINSTFYKNSSIIFIYVSYNNEVDTHEIIKRGLKDKKVICVPKIISKKDGMKAVMISNFDDLHPGAYGILEPLDDSKAIEPSSIETVFLPGIAFDVNGGRIGYGGGFYDRFLKEVTRSTHRIALSYNFQIISSVPMEEEDERIDGIITEKGIHTIY